MVLSLGLLVGCSSDSSSPLGTRRPLTPASSADAGSAGSIPPVPQPTTGLELTGWGGASVRGVSADEVWVNSGGSWLRILDGVREILGPGGMCSTVATDGAIWVTLIDEDSVDYPGGGRLVRITADGYTVSDQVALCERGATQAAGEAGSLWVLEPGRGEVVQVWPDGRRTSIGHPRRVDPAPADEWRSVSAAPGAVCLNGVDPAGSVWVNEYDPSLEDEECVRGTWHRWDGRKWRTAKRPDPFTSAEEKVVAADGVGWMLRPTERGTEIARYANGRIVPVATRPRMSSLAAVSGNRACAFEYASETNPSHIVCFDAAGDIAQYDVSARATADSQFAVAADGSIWLVGSQADLLTQRLPAG